MEGSTATARGLEKEPTGMVAVTARVASSITDTVSYRELVT